MGGRGFLFLSTKNTKGARIEGQSGYDVEIDMIQDALRLSGLS
jgi:hypothetical protein